MLGSNIKLSFQEQDLILRIKLVRSSSFKTKFEEFRLWSDSDLFIEPNQTQKLLTHLYV